MTVDVNSLERKVFQASGADSVGNSLSVALSTTRYRDGDATNFRIEIDNPWSGDTESGFGRTAYISIPVETMLELAKFITKVVK